VSLAPNFVGIPNALGICYTKASKDHLNCEQQYTLPLLQLWLLVGGFRGVRVGVKVRISMKVGAPVLEQRTDGDTGNGIG